ncbi:heme transporter FLVCR1-like isoform X2 [Cloeon dipterum]|uniref:heme transporter FLVCR1-like isoform X2 n=1 Tax=Cloeon dipterum TaxID=197152 RepID=UPI00322087DF
MMQAEDNSRLDPKEEELEDKVERESRPEFRVYKRRWLVLALYLGYVVISAFQWIQYAIITDVIETYYDVPSIAVNWTSMIFMLAFVVTIFPATWFYNKVGLRVALLMAMGGTCVGTWIKVFSVRPDLFWVTMLGQTIVALCQMYVLSIPVPLAATWFGPNEVSTACSIGLLGPQIGGALGFFIPVALMPNDKEDIPGIERGLSYMFFGCSIFATVVFVLQLIFLQAAPPTPPSYAQASRNNERESLQHYVTSLWKLMKNVHFVLIFAAYSINLAVFSAITTFLNQMITPLYEDAQDDAGYMGVLITLTGLVGSVLVGFILDRTRRYKEMNIIVYALSAAATIAFTFVLRAGNLPLLYVTTAVFGFTIVGYLPAAFEFAAELTYPEPEASSAGLMTFGCQILSVLFTLAYDWLFKPFGDLASNLFMSGSLLLGTLLTFFVKSDLRRQRAEHAHQ